MKTRIHAIAGGIGFFIILLFWTSTVISELFASHETVLVVKVVILNGMLVLIPLMIIAGGSGMTLGKRRKGKLIAVKKKRMPIIALNGFIVLLPSAWFLTAKASGGEFDMSFYAIQAIELIAGGTNLILMGANIRDGLRMTGKLRRACI